MIPEVTIIIPSYNHAKYLPKRIESILGQTYKDYELLIIDDCSPDNSDEVIRRYTADERIQYMRNERNSGTPFSAWGKGAEMARGKYIWICESDDFAEPDFLERGVNVLEAHPNCVLFYTNSNVVDTKDCVIGTTADYFTEVWKTDRWENAFCADGKEELMNYQLMGQTVPNMSSTLIRKDAFRAAYSNYLLKFKLTGDWLFIGELLNLGDVAFSPERLSNFRKHEFTSRARTKSDRSQAEFILTKYRLFQLLRNDKRNILDVLSNDAIRHIYEDASTKEVLRQMIRVSFADTMKLSFSAMAVLLKDPRYLRKYGERKQMAKL